MPYMAVMLFAARPVRIAETIGMPPAQLASKAIHRPFSWAARYSSLPCSASRALLAVTTSLPAPSIRSCTSFATWVPPMVSTPIVIVSSSSSRFISSVKTPSGSSTGRGEVVSISTTRASSRRSPVLIAIASARLRISFATPVPTVPKPAIPTRMVRSAMRSSDIH